MEPITLGSALASTKAAWELLSGAVKARDAAQIESATLELKERLVSMSDIALTFLEKNTALQESTSALKLKNTDLEQKLVKLEEKIADAAKYELRRLSTGALVLAVRPGEAAAGEPEHFLCVACQNEGRKSVLQEIRQSLHAHLACPVSDRHKVFVHSKSMR